MISPSLDKSTAKTQWKKRLFISIVFKTNQCYFVAIWFENSLFIFVAYIFIFRWIARIRSTTWPDLNSILRTAVYPRYKSVHLVFWSHLRCVWFYNPFLYLHRIMHASFQLFMHRIMLNFHFFAVFWNGCHIDFVISHIHPPSQLIYQLWL